MEEFNINSERPSRGRGRPKKGDGVGRPITISVSKEDHEMFFELVRRNPSMSKSDIIRGCIRRLYDFQK